MRIQLSYRERMAGLFLLAAVAGVVVFIVGAAIHNRWLEPRVRYHVHVFRGEGLRAGSPVLLSGLEVGEVGDLTILDDNRVDAEVLVRERFAPRVRQGTRADVKRLLGIGEKRIYLVSPGTFAGPLPSGALITADEPVDLLDAVASIDFDKYLSTMDRAVAAMEVLLGKLEEENRLERMIQAFDQMGPTMEKMNGLLDRIDDPLAEVMNDPSFKGTFRGADKLFNDPTTKQAMVAVSRSFDPEQMKQVMTRMERAFARFDELVADKGDLQGAFAGANRLMNDGRMDRMLTSMEKLTDAEKIAKLVDNMALVADELAKIGPEIPTLSKEMISTMHEMVVVLKALQKTWLLDDESKEAVEELKRKRGE